MAISATRFLLEKIKSSLLAGSPQGGFRAAALREPFDLRDCRQDVAADRFGSFGQIFRQQKTRIGRHELFPRLAERLAAKLIFEIVHRRAAVEPLDERRDVFRRLFDPFLFLGSQLPVFVGMVDFRPGQADFRAAHSRQHLAGNDPLTQHDTHLHEDSVCRGSDVHATRVVVIDASGDYVNLSQDVAFGRPHAEIERREFFISHDDGVRIAFLLVPLVGTSAGSRRRRSFMELRPSHGRAA